MTEQRTIINEARRAQIVRAAIEVLGECDLETCIRETADTFTKAVVA